MLVKNKSSKRRFVACLLIKRFVKSVITGGFIKDKTVEKINCNNLFHVVVTKEKKY